MGTPVGTGHGLPVLSFNSLRGSTERNYHPSTRGPVRENDGLVANDGRSETKY